MVYRTHPTLQRFGMQSFQISAVAAVWVRDDESMNSSSETREKEVGLKIFRGGIPGGSVG